MSVRISTRDFLVSPAKLQHAWLQDIPGELGRGRSTFYPDCQGLQVVDTEFCPHHDLAIDSESQLPEPKLVVTLGVMGCSRFDNQDGGSLVFDQHSTTVASFVSSRGQRRYRAGITCRQLRFLISADWLVRQIGQSEADCALAEASIQLHGFNPTTLSARLLLQQWLLQPQMGAFESVWRQGLASSMVAAELQQCWLQRGAQPSRYGRSDRCTAQAVKAYLDEHFAEPLTLSDLSAHFRLTPFRLKALFEHFFHQSVVDYLIEIRMHHAYRMLQQPAASVADVAVQVGYRHQSNFSFAFRRYFGVLPSRLLRRR